MTTTEVPYRKKIYATGQTWLLWWIAYHALDALPATADLIETLWIQLIFLNIPLQMFLAILAFACAQSRAPGILRAGFLIALGNCALIAAHLALTIYAHNH